VKDLTKEIIDLLANNTTPEPVWFYFQGRFPAGCEYDIYNQNQLSTNWSIRNRFGLRNIYSINWLGPDNDVRYVIGCLNTKQSTTNNMMRKCLFGCYIGLVYGFGTDGAKYIIDHVESHLQQHRSYWKLTHVGEGDVATNATPFIKPANDSFHFQLLNFLCIGSNDEKSKCYDFFIEGFVPTITLGENVEDVKDIDKAPNYWNKSLLTYAYLAVEKLGEYSKIIGVITSAQKAQSKDIISTLFGCNPGFAVGITQATRQGIEICVHKTNIPPVYILQWNSPQVRDNSSLSFTHEFF